MMGEKLNLKLIGVLFLLIFMSILIVTNTDFTKEIVRSFLEWRHLNITLWLFFVISFTIHYLSVKEDESNSGGLIYKHFGKFADSGFAIVTYGLASTTAASILKGVYIQQFFKGEVYFNHFNQIDIYSMLVVSIFLFGYSLYAALSSLVSAIVISKSSLAIPVSDE